MLDTHLPDIKIIRDFIFAGKFADTFTVLCGFDVFVRYKMIHNKCYLVFVKYAFHLHLFDFVNGNR